MIKALASKRLNGRTLHVVEGERLEKGDKVLVQTEAGAYQATITSKGAFSFAVSRNSRQGGDGGRG